MLCVHVPDFRVAVHRRSDPALAGRPVAIVGASGKVIEASVEALRNGVTLQTTAVQARAACSELAWVELDETLCREAFDSLMTRLLELAPRIEAGPCALAYLDTRGLGRLYGTMQALVEKVVEVARKEGFAASVGVARSKLLARLAATRGTGASIVSASREKEFLASLPLAMLEPPKELAEQLFLLGIHTAGQFASLDAAAVAARYGPQGVHLRRMAAGEDDEPFRPWRPVPEWSEEVPVDFPLTEAERLIFLLTMPLERLLERLAAEGLACQELSVELELGEEKERLDLRRLGLAVAPAAASAAVARTFLELLRLDLERTPTAGPVTRVRLEVAAAGPPFGEQGRLFDRGHGHSAAVAQAIAKLKTRLGEEAVFNPEVVDAWRPEKAYRHGETSCPGRPDRRAKGKAGPVGPRATAPSGGTDVPPAGLRLLPEPAPIRVRERDGRPVYLVWKELSTPITSSQGPWSLSGEWWAGGYDRDYHEVDTASGRRLWIFRDCRSGAWFVQASEE